MGQTTGQSTDTQQPLNKTTVESSHTITTASLTALRVYWAMDELNKTIRKCEAMRSYIERTRTFSADPHS